MFAQQFILAPILGIADVDAPGNPILTILDLVQAGILGFAGVLARAHLTLATLQLRLRVNLPGAHLGFDAQLFFICATPCCEFAARCFFVAQIVLFFICPIV